MKSWPLIQKDGNKKNGIKSESNYTYVKIKLTRVRIITESTSYTSGKKKK